MRHQLVEQAHNVQADVAFDARGDQSYPVDAVLASAAAEKQNQAIELGDLAKELYERFVQEGSGDLDFSAIIHAIRQR